MDELSGSVARSVAWVFPQNLGNLGARRVEFLASRSSPQENRKNEATCVTHGGADDALGEIFAEVSLSNDLGLSYNLKALLYFF